MQFGTGRPTAAAFSQSSHINISIPGKDPVELSARITLIDGLLEIENVGSADRAVYSCEASNSVGSISKSVKLTLKGNSAAGYPLIP